MNAIDQRHYDPAVFMVQVPVIDAFIKHLAAHRALHRELADRAGHAPVSFVLVASSDANLLMAIIDWCMVFGSEYRNEVHVYALRPDAANAFTHAFCAEAGISEQEWAEYRESMRVFRNKFAAHRDLEDAQLPIVDAGGVPRAEWRAPVPLLDLAEKAAFFWDDWARTMIYPDEYHEPPLRDLAVQAAARAAAEVAAIFDGISRAPAFPHPNYA